MTFPVSEIFGPTIQGEGPAAGRPASFVRLGGCNLSCSWCDSAYTWDGGQYDLRQQLTPMTVEAIVGLLPAVTPLIILTGGEPLLHQVNPHWPELIWKLAQTAELHIETNGTIAPIDITQDRAGLIVVSPKMEHAGHHRGKQDPTMNDEWPAIPNAVVKVVVRDAADVVVAVARCQQQGWPNERIWVMPEGTDSLVLADRWPEVAQQAADLGINASHRLHVLAWKDKRGH